MLTNWTMKTGLHKTMLLEASTWSKLVKMQYFYSGGSLREFCRTHPYLKTRVENDCVAVQGIKDVRLVYAYVVTTSTTMDRIWSYYIIDCSNEEHYRDPNWWKYSVDSGYELTKLGNIIDMGKQLEMYKHAESMGAFFHGVTYELLFHRIVREASAKRKPVVLNMQGNSKYVKIEIQVPNFSCSGEDEATCYSCLKTLGKETYWHPDYHFFPFVDAVTTCKAYSSGSHKFQTIMAFIHVTIQSEKKFEEDRLRELNDEMDKNKSLRDMKRAFVVVCPNFSVCEEFVLHNTPKPEDFLTMVSCFDPNQLEAKHA